MIQVTINPTLLESLPYFHIGILGLEVTVKDNPELNEHIHQIEKEIQKMYSLEDVLKIPSILDARNAYKKLGKDPSRYRLASESLLRRIVKGNELYRINNVVDTGNLISIITKKSVSVFDANQINGDVVIEIGNEEIYEGIGRGVLDISNIPVFKDEVGIFGTTTSDSPRTRVTSDTKNVLFLLISFSNESLENEMELAKQQFLRYTNAKIVHESII